MLRAQACAVCVFVRRWGVCRPRSTCWHLHMGCILKVSPRQKVIGRALQLPQQLDCLLPIHDESSMSQKDWPYAGDRRKKQSQGAPVAAEVGASAIAGYISCPASPRCANGAARLVKPQGRCWANGIFSLSPPLVSLFCCCCR